MKPRDAIIVLRCCADDGKCGKRGTAWFINTPTGPQLRGRPLISTKQKATAATVKAIKEHQGATRVPEMLPGGGRGYWDDVDLVTTGGDPYEGWTVSCPLHGRGFALRSDVVKAFAEWKRTGRTVVALFDDGEASINRVFRSESARHAPDDNRG